MATSDPDYSRQLLTSRPTVVLYCLFRYGTGHWVRTAALAEALVPRFRVVVASSGDVSSDLQLPAGVERVDMPQPPDQFVATTPGPGPGLGVALASLVDRLDASLLVIESFPFGRQNLIVEMSRCLVRLRARPRRPLVVSSTRDMEQTTQRGQDWLDRLTRDTANRYFDAVLAHTDPRVVRFGETFPLASELTIPVFETGYVTRDPGGVVASVRAPVVIVSAGGGRGGDALVLAAAAAQERTDLSADFAMRVYAGTYVSDSTWERLQAVARGTPRLEVARWSSDLRAELGRASVSVSRCGYNTAVDVIASGVRALMVPFAPPNEDEQTRRAGRLAGLGLARVAAEAGLTPDGLASEIRQMAGWSPASMDVDLGGARCSAALLHEWVAPGTV